MIGFTWPKGSTRCSRREGNSGKNQCIQFIIPRVSDSTKSSVGSGYQGEWDTMKQSVDEMSRERVFNLYINLCGDYFTQTYIPDIQTERVPGVWICDRRHS